MDWVEQAGMEAAEEDRVMEEERWKTVQLMGVLDKLYSERLVLIRHIGHHEDAWAARTGRVVVFARETDRVNEVDHRIYWAQLMIKQRQEEVHPIQYEKTCCEQSAPVPSPPSGLSPVPSRPSPAPSLLPQSSAVSSQAPLVSPLPSQQSQQVRGEEEASRKVDDEQRESEKRESEKGESENREDEREEEPPQQQEHDPSKAKGEPELIDLFGAGGEGAGQQQLLRRQQRQQQQSQAKEGRAADLSAGSTEDVKRDDEIVDGREEVEDRVDEKVVDGGVGEDEQVEEKMDDGGCSAEGKYPLQEEELELVLAKKRVKSLLQQQQQQQQQQQPKHEGLLPPPPWPPPLSSQKGNVNGEVRWVFAFDDVGVLIARSNSYYGTGWFGLVSTAWWRGYGAGCSDDSGSETDGSESERTGQG